MSCDNEGQYEIYKRVNGFLTLCGNSYTYLTLFFLRTTGNGLNYVQSINTSEALDIF